MQRKIEDWSYSLDPRQGEPHAATESGNPIETKANSFKHNYVKYN